MDIVAQVRTLFHPWGHLLTPAPAVLPTELYQWPHICQPLMGTEQKSEVTHFGAPRALLHTGLFGSTWKYGVFFFFTQSRQSEGILSGKEKKKNK